jgi:ABC-2 type transport system permease protein
VNVARRVMRLWGLYAWMDLVWLTRDLKYAAAYLISDLILGIASASTTLLLAARFGGIGIWTRDEIIFMLGFGVLARGIVDACFGYNVAFISRRIGRGQLDHMLIQPQSLWLALLTDGFNPVSGSGIALPGLALLIWSAVRLSLSVTPGWLALFALNLAASCAVILAFTYLWSCAAFWAPRAAEEISSSTMRLVDQLKGFPLDGLGAGVVVGLLGVVPAGFVAWYPSRALLGLDPAPSAIGVTPLAAVVLWTITALVFRKGMKHYGRTGSQRYLSLGHRG